MGNSNTTIGRSGCFITSLAMFCGKTPNVVNSLLTKGGGYSSGGLLNSDKAAAILGLPYHGRTGIKQSTLCIAETDHFAPKVPQHFFVWLGDGNIIDSLDGKKKKNPYHIVSYRLFQPLNNQGDLLMATLNQVKLKDVGETVFNWFHDSINPLAYPGWTVEIYNKNGVNAYREWIAEYGADTTFDKILNIAGETHKGLIAARRNAAETIIMYPKVQQQLAQCQANGGNIDKAGIANLAQQIINKVK